MGPPFLFGRVWLCCSRVNGGVVRGKRDTKFEVLGSKFRTLQPEPLQPKHLSSVRHLLVIQPNMVSEFMDYRVTNFLNDFHFCSAET